MPQQSTMGTSRKVPTEICRGTEQKADFVPTVKGKSEMLVSRIFPSSCDTNTCAFQYPHSIAKWAMNLA
jgi:hypothetical protein